MKPYFDTREKEAALLVIAESWRGTPFMDNAQTKGGGVSCQKLAGAIYIEAGFLPPDFQIPEGPMNWAHAHKDSLIADFMDASPDFVAVDSWQAGDLVGFNFAGCLHHCGLVLNSSGSFIHTLRGNGVMFSSLRDASFLKRIGKIWRPMI